MKNYLKYVPNALTITRFLLIPLIIVLALNNNYIGAIIVLTISGITDVLDGCIARKYNLITDFGKLMDPLADKMTQISLLLTITFKQIISFWIVGIVIFKEFLMVSGASFLYGKELVVSSKWYGKLATVLFYIAIVLSLLLKQFEPFINSLSALSSNLKSLIFFIDTPIYYLALLATLFSLVMYIRAFLVQGYLKKKNV